MCSAQDAVKVPSVSIIVPTYNSAKTLSMCLESVVNQCLHKEVLVVDNYSEDETRQIAEKFGAKIIFHRGTQSAARNAGLAQAKGDYILFLDSDQRLEEGVIKDCLSTCLTYGVEAVKIPEVFVGLSFWGKCSALWKNRMVRAWGFNGGIPRFYKRNILLRYSAFQGNLRLWEDLELYQRLKRFGLRETWCRKHIIHYEIGSLQDITRKYLTYGRSIAAFKSARVKVPYNITLKLAIPTVVQLLKDPGKAINVFLGCLFLLIVKSFSLLLGFVLGLGGRVTNK